MVTNIYKNMRMEKGLVSIITPVYNGERFIRETLDSVLHQTYPDWEMIVVDDGSKDRSAAIVEEYAAKDNRIRLLRQANAGSAAARNKGIHCANGQYILVLPEKDAVIAVTAHIQDMQAELDLIWKYLLPAL